MRWHYSKLPNPEISQPWSNELWPPSEWYEMPELSFGRVRTLWRYEDPVTARTLVTKMTEEQLSLWAVYNMIGQVCNGGFSQALYNSYGELSEEAVSGLRMFGFDRHAQIFDEAWNAFGIRPIPRHRQKRIAHLESLANVEPMSVQSSFIGHATEVFNGTSTLWEYLEKELFSLLGAKTHGDGYHAAFYNPLAEWINQNRNRFFIV